MKTYIVLIPVEEIDARKICEHMENYKFNIGDSVQATAFDLKTAIQNEFSDENNILKDIEVESLTDFMDRVNDEQFNPDNYFISYVHS